MKKLNIEFLLETKIEEIIENLNYIFERLVQEVRFYLNLDVIYSDVKVEYVEISKDLKYSNINFGVKKTYKENSIYISIYNNYRKFIKVILLKQAYNCFIPTELQENEIVNIFINQKVETDLQNSEFVEDWKDLRRQNIINYEFIELELNRLEKFLNLKSTTDKLSPFQFFFFYIRKNIQLIGEGRNNVYDLIFEEYTRKYTEYNDEILETIRVITRIFYKARSYRSLLDYQKLFTEYKKAGIIQTSLSLRKFAENMQWIKNLSTIAPAFYINWNAIDLISTICFLKFNPLIEIAQINKVIKEIPFFLMVAYSRNNFGIEVRGFFLLPKAYLDDVFTFLEKLELEGYLIKKSFYLIKNFRINTNLNYFRSYLRKGSLVNPEKREYKKEFEIDFGFEYQDSNSKSSLSLFDWLLIDRIRYYSITGLGFERKSETLKALKTDLLDEIVSQQKFIADTKKNLNKIHNSQNLRKKILKLIDINKAFGFFYFKQIINDYLIVLDLIGEILTENPIITNFLQLKEFIKNQGISKLKSIEANINFKNLKMVTLNTIISSFFKSEKNFNERVEEYRVFYNLFKSFYQLKLFNLESIKSVINGKSFLQKIYQSKEKKLKASFEGYKIYDITYHTVEQRLEDFLNNDPPIIHPSLLNTFVIQHIIGYNAILILKDTKQNREDFRRIRWLFPRFVFCEISEYKTKEKCIYIHLLLPHLKSQEKRLLFTILYNKFKNNIISLKPYYERGFQEAFTRKDFYDLERENFFYTKDLFDQFYQYVQNVFNIKVESIPESINHIKEELWLKKKFVSQLVTKVKNRTSKKHQDFNITDLNNLLDFFKNLRKNLTNTEKFKLFKEKNFFRNYVKSIKLIPSFQSFGLGQYFLFFYPINLNEIDFKHLLHNSFQKIMYPTIIDNSNSFFINFIWPYHNPNISLLNWLTKSKRVIREYCLFFIKKVFQNIHFNYNLSINEWDLDPNRFKIYFQNILFNPDYKLIIPKFKEFNIGDLSVSNYFAPESSEFEALTQLYSWKSIDIKSYLGTRNYTIINSIIELLEKKLIFPIISVKNLDLIEKLYIILPDVKKDHNHKLLKIFSFFNIGFIYEIEGKYYIHGMIEEKKFENGLMIKLFLPDCRLDEFEKLFDLIFEYLGIKHYIILNDMVDGKYFLKSIYGNLDFLKSYNPLKNLIWNDKDKIWMNHKLFDGKFEKIYPDMFPEDNMKV
ncbi:MAG: hypothetical protein ACFE8C_05940 [Promethearchaeota archaeon]